MKPFYIILLAMLLFSVRSQAQRNTSEPTKFKKGKTEQGITAPDGRRIGKWNFYGLNDELELTFDYDSSRINFMQPDTSRYLVRVGDQWELRYVNRAPRFLGSNRQRFMDMGPKFRYPMKAVHQGQEGRVVLAFTVDTDGHTKDYIIENSVSPECDQEVWRVVKDLPDNWIPAIYQGQLAAAKFYLFVTFKIETNADLKSQKKEQQPARPPFPMPASVVRGARYAQEVVVTVRAY